MLEQKFHIFATGATSGLGIASIVEFLRELNWQNLITVLVSLGSAAVSGYVSMRQVKREQDRLDAESRREQQMADLVQTLTLHKAALDAGTACKAVCCDLK